MKAAAAALLLLLPAGAFAQLCPASSPQPDAYCEGAGVPYCKQARQLMQRAAAVYAQVEACDGQACSVEQALQQAYEARDIRHRWDVLPRNGLLSHVKLCVDLAKERMTRQARAALRSDFTALKADPGAELERRLAALEALPADRRAKEDLEAASRAGDEAFAFWRRMSLEFDQHEMLTEDDVQNRREPINDFAARLAGWRDRLITLYREAGLAPHDAPAEPSAAVAADARKLGGHRLRARFDLAHPGSVDLFDPRPLNGAVAVPAPREQVNPLYRGPARDDSPPELARAPAPANGVVPAVAPSVYGLEPGSFRELAPAAADMLKQARAFTRVVGDPLGHAALVHHQTGQDCSVVSQQEILQGTGAVRKEEPRALEARLSAETWKLGYRAPGDEGTYTAANGNLLESRGLLIAKHRKTDVARLDAALASGRMLTVDVDARKLWRNPKEPAGSHTILVTGARVDGAGRVVGYYVNDSGYGPSGLAARYVTREEFLSVWQERFVETR